MSLHATNDEAHITSNSDSDLPAYRNPRSLLYRATSVAFNLVYVALAFVEIGNPSIKCGIVNRLYSILRS